MTIEVSEVFGYGLLSARPAAGAEGQHYYATDTDLFYRDNGSTWDTLSMAPAAHAASHASGGSDAVLPAAASQIEMETGTEAALRAVSPLRVAQAIAALAAAGSFPTARARRTAGDYTLNSTTWANVDTGLDLTVAAVAGDVLQVSASGLWGAQAVVGMLDAATIVSASPVNYISGGGGASDQGVMAWWGTASTVTATLNVPIGGGLQYVVQAGDIDGGNVVLRLRYRTATAANKTLLGTTALPFHWSVVNLRQ